MLSAHLTTEVGCLHADKALSFLTQKSNSQNLSQLDAETGGTTSRCRQNCERQMHQMQTEMEYPVAS